MNTEELEKLTQAFAASQGLTTERARFMLKAFDREAKSSYLKVETI